MVVTRLGSIRLHATMATELLGLLQQAALLGWRRSVI